MSATVPPTPPPSLATALASAQVAARGTVVSGPDTATLTQGLSLIAQVVSSSSGQVVLSTSLGRITLQSSAALPNGTSLVLQVQSVGETARVSLHFQQNPATAQGAAQGTGATHGTAAVQGSGPLVAQPAAPVVTQLTEGSVLQASVTRGTELPATGATPSPPAPAVTPAASGTAVPASSAGQTAAPALAAGTSLTVRVLAVAPPGGPLPTAPPIALQPGGRVLAATVTGHQSGGSPVLTTDTVDLTLPNAHPLPTGSRLLLEVVNLRPPIPGQEGALLSFLGGRWDALGEALSALQQIDPALARHVIETAIPNPGPRMGATMMFFLSAVFSGDVRRFLGGEAMRQLGRGAGGVGERLSSEFSQLQRPAADGTGQDWRLFLIPILTEEGLEQLRFMLRRNEEEEKSTDGETGTRFMIEVNMSRLGPFQFDGLTRKKHLDLVVRTQQELPTEMRDRMRSIFGNTITALGFTGTIVLRVVPRFEISPVEQTANSHKDLTV